MKIRVFTPAYNVAPTLPTLIAEFSDVVAILENHNHEVEIMVINDNSEDKTKELLADAAALFPWLIAKNNEANLRNAKNIIVGYEWGVSDPETDIIVCMDSDGEHSPYGLIRHIEMLVGDKYDGLSGSIIFPDHDAPYHDRNMMRFYGGLQAEMAKVDGMFYIQAPGYNLHKRAFVAKALDLLEKYQAFFAENTEKEFPSWGMHFVMIYLLSIGADARIKALYLECFGLSPNRTPEKLLAQASASQTHMEMLEKFMPKH